jgi:hypothetical protein
MILVSTMTVNANRTDISLNPSDWNRPPDMVDGTNYNDNTTAPSTITQTTPDNYLQATKTTATIGESPGPILELFTNQTYDFQNAILYSKWEVNGQGSYSGVYVGIPSAYGHFETGWSFNAPLISDNTWIYSKFVFSTSGYTYDYSYNSYGDPSGFLMGAVTVDTSGWPNESFFFNFGDNAIAGAYFELAEAYITTPQSNVPEPCTMLLVGSGLWLGWRHTGRGSRKPNPV